MSLGFPSMMKNSCSNLIKVSPGFRVSTVVVNSFILYIMCCNYWRCRGRTGDNDDGSCSDFFIRLGDLTLDIQLLTSTVVPIPI